MRLKGCGCQINGNGIQCGDEQTFVPGLGCFGSTNRWIIPAQTQSIRWQTYADGQREYFRFSRIKFSKLFLPHQICHRSRSYDFRCGLPKCVALHESMEELFSLNTQCALLADACHESVKHWSWCQYWFFPLCRRLKLLRQPNLWQIR